MEAKRNIQWTRSRAYKKNDQAHVEQKNFTHVRQLLGYGRFGDLTLKQLVDDLYVKAWLPLRNYFTPVMKLVKKQRHGSKIRRGYDSPATPCDRLLVCAKVSEEAKTKLRATRRGLDPMELAADVERRLGEIFKIVERIEEERAEVLAWVEEEDEVEKNGDACPQGVSASVAIAPCAYTPSGRAGKLAKVVNKGEKTINRRGS